MKDYKEFTFGWIIFVFVIPIYVFLAYLHLNHIGDRPISANGHVLFTFGLVLACLLTYGLTTKVTSDAILISYGIGLIRKRIKLKHIEAVKTITSPWYYGWGIRLIPNGMLYNITGTGGVELKFNDSSRIIRIGSPDPSTLKKEIEARLKRIIS
jgi:hypothetical protein